MKDVIRLLNIFTWKNSLVLSPNIVQKTKKKKCFLGGFVFFKIRVNIKLKLKFKLKLNFKLKLKFKIKFKFKSKFFVSLPQLYSKPKCSI